MNHHWFGVLIGNILLTYVAVRVLAQEEISEPARAWLLGKWGWAHDMVSCPFCLSCWLAPVVALVFPSTWLTPLHQTCCYIVGVAALAWWFDKH